MKRAFKTKLHSCRQERPISFESHCESELLRMIDIRYFRNNSSPSTERERFYAKVKTKLKEFFKLYTLPTVRNYIDAYWYSIENSELCGMLHSTKILFRPTTRVAQTYCSTLKRLFILLYNGPRIDVLVYLLDGGRMMKFKADYFNLLSGRKKPYWCWVYVKEWHLAKIAVAHDGYVTTNFISSCLAWSKSQSRICKHFPIAEECNKNHQLTLGRRPQVFQVGTGSTKERANVESDIFIFVKEVTTRTIRLENVNLLKASTREGEQCNNQGEQLKSFFVASLLILMNSNRMTQEVAICAIYVREMFYSRLSQYRNATQTSSHQKRTSMTWDSFNSVIFCHNQGSLERSNDATVR